MKKFTVLLLLLAIVLGTLPGIAAECARTN